MKPFDHNSIHNSNKKFWSLTKAFVVGWVLWGLISLGVSIAVIVVVVHFITKFW